MNIPKSFTTLASAKSGVRNAGLGGYFPDRVRFENCTGSFAGAKKIMPVILCYLIDDVRECRDRGFKAELVPEPAKP